MQSFSPLLLGCLVHVHAAEIRRTGLLKTTQKRPMLPAILPGRRGAPARETWKPPIDATAQRHERHATPQTRRAKLRGVIRQCKRPWHGPRRAQILLGGCEAGGGKNARPLECPVMKSRVPSQSPARAWQMRLTRRRGPLKGMRNVSRAVLHPCNRTIAAPRSKNPRFIERAWNCAPRRRTRRQAPAPTHTRSRRIPGGCSTG